MQELLLIHKSAFYWPECTQPGTMSRGELPLWVDEPWTFTKGLTTHLGPTRGLPTATWGVHTYIPCTLVAGLALQSKDWGVKSVRVNSAFHPSGAGTWAGGTLDLPGGELPSLTKGLKLGSYRSGPGGNYGGTLVTVVTAVLKAVLSQGDIQRLQSSFTIV